MGKTIDLTATYGIDCFTAIDEIIRGDSYSRKIKVKGLDVTDYVGRCHWLNVPWDTPSINTDNIVFSTDNDILPIDIGTEDGEPIGSFIITITTSESATLTPTTNPNTGIIYGDLEISDGTDRRTIYRFKTKIRGDATK